VKRIGIILLTLWIASLCPGQEQDIFGLVQSGQLDKVEELLKASPLLVNATDRAGRTPLFVAVSAGNLNMVRLLVDKGALVRIGDNNLRTPIHFANWRGDKDLIDFLLQKGAVVDTRAIGAATPLIHSSLSDNFEMSCYLIERGADIEVQCNSLTTPLYFAVLNNNQEYFQYLVRLGADVDVPDFLDRTPLTVAVRDGNLILAEFLVKSGADLFRRDKHLSRSLLHLAAIEGHADVLDFLIQSGLKVDEKDLSGSTAFDYARRYSNFSAARLLEGKGAEEKSTLDKKAERRPSASSLKTGEAEIIKLQNGSWAVSTRSVFLIFGYSEIGAAPPEKSLTNGHMTSEVLAEIQAQGKSIIYLDRDFHPARRPFSLEGYNPLYALQKTNEQISFILNPAYDRMYAGLDLKNAFFPRLNEKLAVGSLKCTVRPAYGNHSCMVLESDGLTIVWLTGISDNYLVRKRDAGIIDRLALDGVRPDILLLGSPTGIGPEIGNGIREAYLEARRLRPRAVFAFGHELLERRILGQIRRRIGEAADFHCAANPGDFFVLKEGDIQ
jgi:ankyrin repeat protein